MEKSTNPCPGCLQRDQRIAALEAEVAALRQRCLEQEAEIEALNKKLDELMRRLPPKPPRPQARYPKAPAKKGTKKKKGGQQGHPPHLKQLAPPERVNEVIQFTPEECSHCGELLTADSSSNDPPPTRFQVAELPVMAAHITEYQGHARVCGCCGKVTRETIPAELCGHSLGPRYSATLSYFVGAHGVSKRGMEEISAAVFDAPVSLGTIANLEQEMSDALAEAHEQAVAEVRTAEVKHVDETGWKQGGKKRWLWVAATSQVVVFLIHRLRNSVPLVRLLGEKLVGIVCSDRWHAYTFYGLDQRQLCWAHIKRNFAKLAERKGIAKEVGEAGLAVQKQVFALWHQFREGGLTREQLIETFDPLEKELVRILSRGAHSKDKKTVRFCNRLFRDEEALWTFVRVKGIEPTNNHAERVQRRAVLWRRRCFGCQSAWGCRFVERILTVIQTLRLQERSALEYLTESIRAKRTGQPGPALV